ncbi:MAG: RagB/SusD family nutrient uptake outer membrane protein [Bacteroidales bacterium]|nr:RagB/SusD family nutrient uptake outer membrane protein [Bacteroidales bacterium]
MKKIKNIALALAASMTMLTGCFDLTEEAFSEIVQESFTPSEQDVASLLASAYTPLAFFFDWQGLFDAMEEPADVVITPVRPNGWDDGGTYQRMHKHTWSAEEWQPWNVYETGFTGVNNCNRVLGQLEDGSLPVDEESKASMVNELRAVRALWYSILLDSHGNVPIVTAFTDEVPAYRTRQEVYEFVVKEFTEVLAANTLTKEKSASTYSRLNHWTTEMALMRVYLNAEVYTGTPAYDRALALASDIVDNSPYTLSANYSDNFIVNLGPDNTEVMFAIPYDAKFDTGGHVFSQNAKWYPPVSKEYFGWSYQCWGGSCANPQFVNSYQPGDTRKELTWMYGPCAKSDGSIVWTNLNYLPSLTSKPDAGKDKGKSMTSIDFGLRQNKYGKDLETEFYWGNDMPFFRLAEAYLTKAECLLRLGQNEADAVAAVNAVRARVAPAITAADLKGDTKMVYGLLPWGSLTYEVWQACNDSHDWSSVVEELEASQKPKASAADKAKVALGGMYDEWGWEFALEGLRRQQMIRFGTYSTKNWFNHEAISDGHTALFPIPLDVLNSNANLKQNPGY